MYFCLSSKGDMKLACLENIQLVYRSVHLNRMTVQLV